MQLRHARLVAYDISEDGRRQRVARYLERQGLRIQKSVFLVNVRSDKLRRIRDDLAGLVAPCDTVDIIPVCANCRAHSLRIGPHQAPAIVILGEGQNVA